MLFSYSQLSQYLACPRRYRYRYVDGWCEQESSASLLFGRSFDHALSAHFLGKSADEMLRREWQALRHRPLTYSPRTTWQAMLEEGLALLRFFIRDGRVQITRPQQSLQVRFTRRLGTQRFFVGYIDAVGAVDGMPALIEWKTSASCYPAQPAAIVALDPQLVCYSWLSGIAEVALVVFVRKRVPEIQYLHATISERQRQEFAAVVAKAIAAIEAAHFPQHGGIRFPQNHCVSCPYLGLCADDAQHVGGHLVRAAGGDHAWLDQLDY